MKTTLLLFHPNIENSTANKYISETLSKLDNLTVINMYKKYPDSKFNIEEEHKILLESDLVIVEFPIHWHGVPFLYKKWEEDILTYNWAYGSQFALEEKKFFIITTTGSRIDDYQPQGSKGFYYDTMITMPSMTLKYMKARPLFNINFFYNWDREEYLRGLEENTKVIIQKINQLASK